MRTRWTKWTLLFFLSIGASGLAFFLHDGQAAPGCCSRHGGVCDCACCDGSKLSDTCRARMSKCGGTSAPSTETVTSFSGKVVKVSDGDTIEVLRDGRAVRIRLAEIDCPEKYQAFGDKARKFTAELAAGKTVTVKVRAIDRYGRTVAEVILPDGRSLNMEILKAGLAWWYRDYSDDNRLGALETEAKAAKRGLWAEEDPIPPWVFRRRD